MMTVEQMKRTPTRKLENYASKIWNDKERAKSVGAFNRLTRHYRVIISILKERPDHIPF